MKPLDKALWVALFALVALRVTGGGSLVGPSVPDQLRIVIVRESGDTTAELARTINALRNGPAAAYLKSKNHRLDVLDDDAVDENGKSVVDPAWISGVGLPVIVLLDGKTGKLVDHQPLPLDADAVLTWLKNKGA